MGSTKDIVQNISEGKRTNSTRESMSELRLDEARAKYKKDQAEKLAAIQKKNIEAQAKLEAALREKGLKESDALWKKFLSEQAKAEGHWAELTDKQRQSKKLDDLKEVYEYESNLDAELAKKRKELNQAILKSQYADTADKLAAFGELLKDGVAQGISNTVNTTLKDLDGLMSKYASYQAKINARIQGTGLNYGFLENNLSTVVGVQPYIKTQNMMENLATLVDSGIAYNMELRAFIQTVKDNIATTFDATNGTLMRLIRIQQADSTAARLGIEANLTRYFNWMFQDTSYLSDAFDTVSGALLEASSTMSKERAVEFEYQVQKWLGSLYGVGVSGETVSGIAQALGMLGSGNVTGLSSSQYQNLLVMAASRAGLSYGELLTGGLNATNTEILLESMVSYLKEIAGGTNKVVQSELGRVFGVTMSDLQSAINLNTSMVKQIASHDVSYAGAFMEVLYQLQAMPGRMSVSTMMDTLWENLEYGLAAGVARNPALYSIWKVAGMIGDYTQGINIPTPFVMGTGVDLNTTVDNLMKLGVVGVGSLGMIGDLISGLSSTAAPASMLAKLQGLSAIQQLGKGLVTSMAGMTQSQTVMVGNSSGEDIYSSAKTGAEGAGQQAIADASADNEAAQMTEDIRDNVRDIKQMLASVIGNDGLKVAYDPYHS